MPYNDADCHELLSLVAHEIRSPAAVVAGYLRLLLKSPAESERQRRESEQQGEPERKIPDGARNIIEEASNLTPRAVVPLQPRTIGVEFRYHY